jgi:MoxR-like ATPase
VTYKKPFDLTKTRTALGRYARDRSQTLDGTLGDRRDGLVYVYTPEIELTVNIALATGRPILLRGPSGAGKSSLAKNVAIRLGRRYYEAVISSATKHTDLLWRFDLLRRFRDAQDVKGTSLKADVNYVQPGPLWWAFDRESALQRGAPPGIRLEARAADPSELPGMDAVVLIDEIDKADPDVPNNLLVTLGSLRFAVSDLPGVEVRAAEPPLVVITSNDERDLPIAFLRRCIVLELPSPDQKGMIAIAKEHFGSARARVSLYKSVAALAFEGELEEGRPRDRTPSTAEYLDAVRTCLQLGIRPSENDPAWKTVVRTTVRKQGRPQDAVV